MLLVERLCTAAVAADLGELVVMCSHQLPEPRAAQLGWLRFRRLPLLKLNET